MPYNNKRTWSSLRDGYWDSLFDSDSSSSLEEEWDDEEDFIMMSMIIAAATSTTKNGATVQSRHTHTHPVDSSSVNRLESRHRRRRRQRRQRPVEDEAAVAVAAAAAIAHRGEGGTTGPTRRTTAVKGGFVPPSSIDVATVQGNPTTRDHVSDKIASDALARPDPKDRRTQKKN